MNLNIKPGPIRHAQLSPALVLRIETVRSVLAEVCPMSSEEWIDGLKRDLNPEQQVLWWERVAGCYTAFIADREFSASQTQGAFKIIFGLFSGPGAEDLTTDLAQFPESVLDELLATVRTSLS